MIQEYKEHTSGVDLFDRIFYYRLNLILLKAWLLYTRVLGEKVQDVLIEALFCAKIAKCSCSIGVEPGKQGRPSRVNREITAERRKRSTRHELPKEFLTDQIDH